MSARFQSFVRLFPAACLFLTASLAILPAPTHFLWMLAIGVTELGYVFAIVCFGLAIPLWNDSWSGRAAAILCVSAAVLALTPLVRAAWSTRELPQQLHKAFGTKRGSRSVPLVIADLFRGLPQPNVRSRLMIFEHRSGVDLSLDFYPAQTSGPAPVIIVIHGGSWNGGDNKSFIGMDRYLAGRGYAVADVLYRLAPQSPFPAAPDDILSAIRFLREHANELNIDPNQIVLLGRSAGGQIALQVAYSANDPGIRGVISFYAPTDLFWSWENPGNPLVIDTRAVLTDYLGGGPSAASANYRAASPLRQAGPKSPPSLLFHGGRDELVAPHHSDALALRLSELRVPHLNVALPWATHGFDYFLCGPGGQISAYAIETFLANVCPGRKTESR